MKVRCGGDDAFVKAAPRARLRAEVDGLAALRATGTVRVPEVRGMREDGLLLEWLDLRPLDANAAARLGAALAALHRATPPHDLQHRFGWPHDNFIGAAAQRNAPSTSWTAFWRERRLAPQIARAATAGHDRALEKDGARLLEAVDVLLEGRAPVSSLVHGDLWSGNAGALPDGTPVLFDPAAYVGDRETDLAMTELFGGFPATFAAAYREAWPVDEGYPVRRELYNLYHLLNHLNLFGASYLARCRRSIARLLAEVR